MPEDDLPNEFDLIVVGTGLTESIVAAAASRIGKSVLHIDSNDFYGGYWASFNLEAIQSLPKITTIPINVSTEEASKEDENADRKSVVENDENIIQLNEYLCCLENVTQKWIEDASTDVAAAEAASESATENNDDTTVKTVQAQSAGIKAKIMKHFRKFNIDITPKLLFSRGELVELLISSNICRYAEFRAVDRVTTLLDGTLKSVPCSRSDVFTTKDVNVVEKRLLMKLLSSCLNYKFPATIDSAAVAATGSADSVNDENAKELNKDEKLSENEFKNYENKTFRQYLNDKRLTNNLSHYVLYAISMSNDKTKCLDGVRETQKFLNSLGRYGNTPFLFPMYGCGEIAQCFCRLCAVFGGVYCLKRPIKQINLIAAENDGDDGEKKQFKSILCGNQTIAAKNIIFGHGSIDGNEFLKSTNLLTKKLENNTDNRNKCGNLSRGIFLINKPIGDEELNNGGGGVLLLKMPPILSDDNGGDGDAGGAGGAGDAGEAVTNNNTDGGAYVIQLSHYSGTCPKDSYLIHITCNSTVGNPPEKDLKNYVDKLFNGYKLITTDSNDANDDDKTLKIIWSMYFNIPSCLKCITNDNSANESFVNGFHLSCGPYFELDYDTSIQESKNLFKKLYPTEEFLPRAPDPEEIVIFGDEDTVTEEELVANLDEIKDTINEITTETIVPTTSADDDDDNTAATTTTAEGGDKD